MTTTTISQGEVHVVPKDAHTPILSTAFTSIRKTYTNSSSSSSSSNSTSTASSCTSEDFNNNNNSRSIIVFFCFFLVGLHLVLLEGSIHKSFLISPRSGQGEGEGIKKGLSASFTDLASYATSGNTKEQADTLCYCAGTGSRDTII